MSAPSLPVLGTNEITSPTLYPLAIKLVTVNTHPVGIGSLNVGKVDVAPEENTTVSPVAVNVCIVLPPTEVTVPPVAFCPPGYLTMTIPEPPEPDPLPQPPLGAQ